MKTNRCLVLILIFLNAKADNFQNRELEIGQPLNNYVYDGRDEVVVNITLRLYNKATEKSVYNEFVLVKAQNRKLKLEFDHTYEFDNGSTIHRFMQFSSNLTETHDTNIILKQSHQRKPKSLTTYIYEANNTRETFQCIRNRTKSYDYDSSLYWIQVKDKNITELCENDFDKNKTLTVNLTEDHDGVELFCFYVDCNDDKVKKEINCTRHVLRHIELKLCKQNCTSILGFQYGGESASSIGFDHNEVQENDGDDSSNGGDGGSGKTYSIDGKLLGGIAGLCVVILILLAAMTWYCRRKAKLKQNVNTTVQYIEIEFSDTPSSSRPIKGDEIIYTQVKGVLYPAQKCEGTGASDNCSTDRNKAVNPGLG